MSGKRTADIDQVQLLHSDEDEEEHNEVNVAQATRSKRTRIRCCSCCSRYNKKDYTALLIGLVTACLFADQNLMAPNLSQIREEFNMTRIEADRKLGGEIALALFLVGGPVSLCVGYLADRLNRRKLYCFVILLGELGCFLTVFVSEFWHLFLLRAMTGIALGGALPLVFSMLSDMYPPSLRNKASSLVGVSMSLGSLLGQLMSGVVGPSSGWRIPFVIVAIPSSVLAVIFLLTAMDPVRASQEFQAADQLPGSEATSFSAVVTPGQTQRAPPKKRQMGYHEEINWVKIKQIFSSRSNRIMFLQGIPGCMPWGMILVYLNDYLYVDNNAPSVLDATSICTLYGVGGMFGILLGGWWGQRLYNWKREYVAQLMGWSTIAGIVPMLLILNLPFSYGSLAPVAFFGGACASITGPNVRAVLQNCNLPETRGTVFAMFALTDDLGKAFGPYIISLFVAGMGRRAAFNIATCMWLLCGVLLLSLSCTMASDEDNVREVVASAKEASGSGGVQLLDVGDSDPANEHSSETGDV